MKKELDFKKELYGVMAEVFDMLVEKNEAYGNSALEPVRIMSSCDSTEQIKVRMDDKLSRLIKGQAFGEDAMKDLVGYYFLLKIAEKIEGDKTESVYGGEPFAFLADIEKESQSLAELILSLQKNL